MILKVGAEEFGAHLEGLSDLLLDAIASGASIGFLSETTREEARAFWEGMRPSATRHAWLAIRDGEVLGTVHLEVCGKANGRHRAEVQKLLVLESQRGKGLGFALMESLEKFAGAAGLELLYLDTSEGSNAVGFYRRLGYLEVGTIPHFAAMPDGEIRGTVVFAKRLGGFPS